MRTLLGAIALLFAFSAGAASLERYKTFLNGTQSARAQFEQKVYDRSGKLTQESRGSFVFQRPGRFRWVYDKPTDQVIVGDGQRVWIYLQAKKGALFSEEGTLDIVVVPSFNPHLSVTGEKYYHKSISPIITRVVQHGVEKCMVVTLDGSVVGDKTILSQTL